MHYSQQDEEKYILDVLQPTKKQGILLDVGAGHPKTYSNSRELIELGWRGLLVEASPFMFGELVKEYANRTDVKLLNATIDASDEPRVVTFHLNQEFISSINEQFVKKWSATWECNYVKVNVYTMPAQKLREVFLQMFKKCDFLNIDIEGESLAVLPKLATLPGLRCICVEHDGTRDKTIKLLDENVWKVFHENDTNTILCKSQ